MNEDIYHINQKSDSRELIRFRMCGTTYPDKHYKNERIASDVACIEYVEEGEGVVMLDDRVFFPKAGDSYFLETGKDQRYHASAASPWKKHFINLQGRLLEDLAESYGVRDYSYFPGLDLSVELGKIVSLGREGGEDNTEELILLLNKIFYKMRLYIKKTTEPRGLEADIKDYLRTQVTERFRMDMLCHRFDRSESQLIRLFKSAYGVTPYAYLMERKISFAKRLLRDTGLSVKQIADKLCFADEYYFSSFFKSRVGVTPSEFRRSQG